MFEAGNISGTVSAVAVANRYFNNFKVEFMRPENQIEIAEWVKIPKEFPVLD